MNIKEKIVFIFFGLSLFLGYGIPILFTYFYYNSFDEIWLIRAGMAYGISWVLFGFFIILAGKKSYQNIKISIKNFFHKKHK